MHLLISDTPVAGTVTRLAQWMQALTGIETHALVRRNYVHNAFALPGGAFGCLPDWDRYLVRCVREADALFIHNVCEPDLLGMIMRARKPGATVIYQYHSPPGEPPQFDYRILRQFSFDAVLAVAQGHGRFQDGAIAVPNVVADHKPSFAIEKARTVFLPHLRSTGLRWSNKVSMEDCRLLEANQKRFFGYKLQGLKSVFGREVVGYDELRFYLHSASVVIDDIHTGLFHQTAIEGLKSGCLVFSAADLYSLEEFCCAIEAPPPPFVAVRGVQEVIAHLSDSTFVRNIPGVMRAAQDYAATWLGAERLARHYLRCVSAQLPGLFPST